MGVDHAAIAHRYLIEIWGEGNLDVTDELVGPELVLRDPLSGNARGIEAVTARARGMRAAFGDVSLTIDEVIASGDRVIVRDTRRGVHRGAFFGFEGTGRELALKAVELLRISAGRVVEHISYFDVYGMFQQLGLLPPPDKLAETLKRRTQGFASTSLPRG